MKHILNVHAILWFDHNGCENTVGYRYPYVICVLDNETLLYFPTNYSTT